MRIEIIGFADGKKIQAIKGIRAATGATLKDAKHIADRVEGGTAVEIDTLSSAALPWLDEHGVRWQVAPVSVSVGNLARALERYPAEMTVGDVCRVLVAAASHAGGPR